MESTLIWHKPTDPVPAGIEVVIIFKVYNNYSISTYTYKCTEVHEFFAYYPIIAWAELELSLIAGKINENFNEDWINFLNKNATK